MAWCFEDECDRYSDNVLTELARSEAIVPGVWPLESDLWEKPRYPLL